jgi:hypothetical protein
MSYIERGYWSHQVIVEYKKTDIRYMRARPQQYFIFYLNSSSACLELFSFRHISLLIKSCLALKENLVLFYSISTWVLVQWHDRYIRHLQRGNNWSMCLAYGSLINAPQRSQDLILRTSWYYLRSWKYSTNLKMWR